MFAVDEFHTTTSLKYTLLSALIVALATVGDAFLYAYLPSNYQNIGISLVWVGILLSVNRFTRLFLNGWVAYYLSEKGIKSVTLATTIIAVVTTISYGIITSVYLWLLVRILWGISFSSLRLSSIVYALHYKKRGLALGLTRGIMELGCVFALLVGPILLKHFNNVITFCILGTISFAGVILAMLLPNVKIAPITKKDAILSFPSSFNRMVLINSFIVEGIVVVLVGRLVQLEYHSVLENSLLEVGFILGYRRICLVVFAPIAGWLADTLGFQKLFLYTTIFLILGLLLISLKIEIIGVLTVFTFSAMNVSLTTGGALLQSTSLLKEVSDNATWRDIGMALGSLVGALLLSAVNIHLVFALSALLILAGLIPHYFQFHKNNYYN